MIGDYYLVLAFIRVLVEFSDCWKAIDGCPRVSSCAAGGGNDPKKRVFEVFDSLDLR